MLDLRGDEMAVGLSGVPEKPEYEDRVVALIEWRDGTVIDTVRQLKVQE